MWPMRRIFNGACEKAFYCDLWEDFLLWPVRRLTALRAVRGPPCMDFSGVTISSDRSTWPYIRLSVFLTASQCCGSGMFIPDPRSDSFHPGYGTVPSGSASKNSSNFNPKILNLILKNKIRVVHPERRILDLDFYSSGILDPDPQHCWQVL